MSNVKPLRYELAEFANQNTQKMEDGIHKCKQCNKHHLRPLAIAHKDSCAVGKATDLYFLLGAIDN